jgi:hypothetical protein
VSIETDYATLRRVIHEFGPTGWAAEFGVYTGYSLNIIANHMPVIGFDSFEGLPEDWRPGFPKGKFSEGWAKHHLRGVQHISPGRQMLVPGWFEDTAPSFPFPPLGLVHIDCDLYSSTVTALDAVTPYIEFGTIIVFDEYHSYPGAEDHEEKAFIEWQVRTDIDVEQIAWGEGEHAQEAAFQITYIPEGAQ